MSNIHQTTIYKLCILVLLLLGFSILFTVLSSTYKKGEAETLDIKRLKDTFKIISIILWVLWVISVLLCFWVFRWWFLRELKTIG